MKLRDIIDEIKLVTSKIRVKRSSDHKDFYDVLSHDDTPLSNDEGFVDGTFVKGNTEFMIGWLEQTDELITLLRVKSIPYTEDIYHDIIIFHKFIEIAK